MKTIPEAIDEQLKKGHSVVCLIPGHLSRIVAVSKSGWLQAYSLHVKRITKRTPRWSNPWYRNVPLENEEYVLHWNEEKNRWELTYKKEWVS